MINYFNKLNQSNFNNQSNFIYTKIFKKENFESIEFPIKSRWEKIYQESPKHFKKFRYIEIKEHKSGKIIIYISKLLLKRKRNWRNSLLSEDIEYKLPLRNYNCIHQLNLLIENNKI